jgi:hypothetical protein
MLVEESCKALGGSSGGEGATVAAAQLQKLPHESVQLRDFHLWKTWPCNGLRKPLSSKRYLVKSGSRDQNGHELTSSEGKLACGKFQLGLQLPKCFHLHFVAGSKQKP